MAMRVSLLFRMDFRGYQFINQCSNKSEMSFCVVKSSKKGKLQISAHRLFLQGESWLNFVAASKRLTRCI